MARVARHSLRVPAIARGDAPCFPQARALASRSNSGLTVRRRRLRVRRRRTARPESASGRSLCQRARRSVRTPRHYERQLQSWRTADVVFAPRPGSGREGRRCSRDSEVSCYYFRARLASLLSLKCRPGRHFGAYSYGDAGWLGHTGVSEPVSYCVTHRLRKRNGSRRAR